MLSVNKAKKIYKAQSGDVVALNGVDISFKENGLTFILGKSGSGKSTLLKLLMRFYDPLRGVIQIGQTPLTDINTSNMRHMFAYVTQETVLFHDSIENNIKIAKLDATSDEIQAACQKASLHDWIMSLPEGYQTPVSELGSSLSGGERQRISLARAFLSQAECILLDEPTSALDPISTLKIEELLLQLKDQYTIAIVTHNMQQASRIADYTAFFLVGEMVEYGPTKDVFGMPKDKRTEDYITGRFG